jgi:hypothetical protein
VAVHHVELELELEVVEEEGEVIASMALVQA